MWSLVSVISLFLSRSQGHSDGTSHFQVQAKLAILKKQFKQAEAIYLERVSVLCCGIHYTSCVDAVCLSTQGEVEQAMTMYQELNRWEDAIVVAETRVYTNTLRLCRTDVHVTEL